MIFFNGLLTRLSVEQTRFIPREVEVGVFLIDPLVTVDPILFWIVPHGVVPPVEQRLGFGLIDGIAVSAAGVVLNQASRHVIDLTISTKRIEHDEEPGLMVIQLVDTRVEVWFGREGLCAPTCQRMGPQHTGEHETET